MAETYDIDETAARAGAALDALRAEHAPAVRSGRGGKAAVLRAVRERLLALSGEGYTTGQVADALRTVIPSISVRAVRAALREAAREGTAKRKGRQRKSARGTRSRTAGVRDAESTPSTAAPASSPHSDPVSDVVRTSIKGPPADPAPSPGTDATPPNAGAAASVELTPELRAQHRIPEWADGSDLHPGEDLAAYARRKRAQGDPNRDLSMFIGEGNRRR